MPPPIAPIAQQQETWTVLSLLQWATRHLTERGFDEARLHVELLLAHVLKCTRLHLYTNYDRPMSGEELAAFKALFKRRLAHEPLQYILGKTEFMGLPLAVDRRVLIPRPETEQLVEQALEILGTIGKPHPAVLDIGTGSGNIAIAIAAFAQNCAVTAMDVSPEALELAADNARINGVDTITFLCADVFDDFLPDVQFDMIVSNPPYISADEFGRLAPEIREFEPRRATTDEADGLRFLRRIAQVATTKVRPGGWLLMEIAYNQSTAAAEIVREAGLKDVQVAADYAGHPRILFARM
jgi:release factor glutamine methyltransferase